MRGVSSPAASQRGWLNPRRWTDLGTRNTLWRLALGACGALLWVNAAVADTPGKTPAGLTGAPLGAEGVLETAAGLMLVLVTILALAWAARRYGRFSMAGKGMVNLLGGIALGSRERVVVVQIEDTRLVLGVAPGRIETLHVLSPAEDAKVRFPKTLEREISELQR